MITGDLKNKIDNLWEVFWTGGLTNPLDVVEQLTYLFFMRDLDDLDNSNKKDCEFFEQPFHSMFPTEVTLSNGEKLSGELLKWSVFKTESNPDRLFDIVSLGVFPFIKSLSVNENTSFAKNMENAVFKIPREGTVLLRVIRKIDEIYDSMKITKNVDIRGDVYEYLLSKIAQSGVNGQFRTPRHIIDMIVKLAKPIPADYICDPACGTAGFLIGAESYLMQDKTFLNNKEAKEHFQNDTFFGFDTDKTMLRIASMNMILHNIKDPKIQYMDSISEKNKIENRFTLILANPPFKGSVDELSVSQSLKKMCNTKKTELLFLALMLRMLKVGGRCACIVPSGVLFGTSKAHKDLRKKLVEENILQAVISLPSGVFKPYAGVSTAILIFTKTGAGGTKDVWFYDMHADGFSLDDKRNPVEENDIPDIIARFDNLEHEKVHSRTDQSFLVPKQEIADNNYDLSFNKYREIVHEKVEYPSTDTLLTEIKSLQNEIAIELKELESLLNA